jgi:hypothetical protein
MTGTDEVCSPPQNGYHFSVENYSRKSSRGDCRSFEPFIAAWGDAALSSTAESVVATRVVWLSARLLAR